MKITASLTAGYGVRKILEAQIKTDKVITP